MKKIIAIAAVMFSLVGTSLSAHAGPHQIGPFGIDYPTFQNTQN